MPVEWITTQRDINALTVPDGRPVTIPEGTAVLLTQALGDSFTVNLHGNLARIEGADADALGKQATTLEFDNIDPSGAVNEEHIWQQLRTCYDPEIPVNIVDLGLVYACEINNNDIHIKMTLTAPGCGMGGIIADEVKYKLQKIPNAGNVFVELVFDPPWNQSMLSETAKVELGMF